MPRLLSPTLVLATLVGFAVAAVVRLKRFLNYLDFEFMARSVSGAADGVEVAGDPVGGPPPFSKTDRSRFLSALDEAIVRMKRGR